MSELSVINKAAKPAEQSTAHNISSLIVTAAPGRDAQSRVLDRLAGLAEPKKENPHAVLQQLAGDEKDDGNKYLAYLKQKWPNLETRFGTTLEVAKRAAEFLDKTLPEKDETTLQLKAKILEKLIDQQVTNPEQYVSHGADHSLEVAEVSGKLYDALPLLRDQLISVFGSEAKTILTLTSLLHDTGYPLLKPEEKKFIHASLSGVIFNDEIKQLFGKRFALNEDQLSRIGFAIEHHSDDGVSNPHVVTPASEKTHPLLFTLRLSDIMDMTADRLTEIQRNPNFHAIIRKLFIEGQPGGQLFGVSDEVYATRLDKIKKEELMRLKDSLDTPTYERLVAIVMYVNDVSYPHFVGCMAIREVNFIQADNGSLIVKVKKDKQFQEDGDLLVNNRPVTTFQLMRAEIIANNSLQYNGAVPQIELE